MSLQVFVGHSGESLAVDTTTITTLDALRALITSHAGIQQNRQVLLTVKGKSVRQQALLVENELYVFDSGLLSSSASAIDLKDKAVHIAVPAPLSASGPPDIIASQTDLGSWQTLFHDRLEWARRQREQCASSSALAQESLKQQMAIRRGLGVALDSLGLHLKGAEQKHTSALSWANELLADQEHRLETWQNDSQTLASIPARGDFARFIQYTHTDIHGDVAMPLGSILPFHQIQRAATRASAAMDIFKRRLRSMKSILDDVKKQSEELYAATGQLETASDMEANLESEKLMEEIDIVLKKIASDESHVSTLPHTTQSLSQASKMALLHTRNYLPNLQEYSREMNGLVRKTVEQRNTMAETCMQHMQALSRVESNLSRLLADVRALHVSEEDQEAFSTLNIASRLPYVYGALLIEALRRRQLLENMSNTPADELAAQQEEESRRRQKWLDSVDDVVQPELVTGKAGSIQAEPDSWPNVTYQEVEDYIIQLGKTGTIPAEVTQELTLALQSVAQSTRKQTKHTQTFLAGSIHDAAFRPANPAAHNDEEYSILRAANTKLQEELRGQQSRVRKLEDLLHRQSSLNRAVSGDVFTPGIELASRTQSVSPLPSPGSRRPSGDYHRAQVRDRRPSSNQGIEEKKLARRLVTMEAELQSQKDRNVELEKQAMDRNAALENRVREIEEAEAIKKDIMSNMEAQGREFATERRGLEEELTSVRGRVEELEDELDRILGSRDHERGGLDAKTKSLEEDLVKARNQLDSAEKEHANALEETRQKLDAEQNRVEALEGRLQEAMAAKSGLEISSKALQSELDGHREAERNHAETLIAAHGLLDTTASPPTKYASLVSAMEELARKATTHVKDLTEAAAMAKAENESLRIQVDTQAQELSATKTMREEHEATLARANEQLAAATNRSDMLATQLEDEREQLKLLRGKFADGETGADALRQRVEEQDDQVGKLMEQLSEARSHEMSLDAEIMRIQSKTKASEEAAAAAKSRLDDRAVRAKDVTIRLFAQNARLMRLLETLGFAVSHKEGQMIIERASKAGGASLTLTEPSQILSRAVSLSNGGTMSTIRKMSDPATEPDPSLAFLHWADLPSQTAEDIAYEQLVSNLSLFSIDSFSDAIAKRLRDFEYTARKFRLEARNASTKATRYSHEASQKLAVRDFKEGDLALFLPTKGKAVGAWAAFNINAPHHFLREKESMSLSKREWLVARITKVEERVVDLSRSLRSTKAEDGGSLRSAAGDSLLENDNPFDLSDGLTWYLVHAQEERGGAPATPGPGKSTVQASAASANAERPHNDAVKDLKGLLGRSLSSRRSSSVASKRSAAPAASAAVPIAGRPAGEAAGPLPSTSLLTAGLTGSAATSPKQLDKQQPAELSRPKTREGRGRAKTPADEDGGWRRIWSVDYGG